LPDAAENAELLAIEDVICRHVLAKAVGLFALTLTTGVMKEWVFYIAPDVDIATLHADIRGHVTSHEVQCMAVEESRTVLSLRNRSVRHHRHDSLTCRCSRRAAVRYTATTGNRSG